MHTITSALMGLQDIRMLFCASFFTYEKVGAYGWDVLLFVNRA